MDVSTDLPARGDRTHLGRDSRKSPAIVALLKLLSTGTGCHIYEDTEVETIEGTPITATTTGGQRIHCEHVLVATHVPLQGKPDFFPRRYCSRSSRPIRRTSSEAGLRAAAFPRGCSGTPGIPTTTCAWIARAIMTM